MLDQNLWAECLDAALVSGGDFAELFLEEKDELSIRLAERVVQGVTTVRIHGVGLHLLKGTSSVYVYTSDTSPNGLKQLAGQAAQLLLSEGGRNVRAQDFTTRHLHQTPNPIVEHPSGVPHAEKIALLREMDAAARDAGRIAFLGTQYFDTDQRVVIANSEGLWAEDRRVASRLRLSAAVSDGVQTLSEWGDFTRPQGFEAFRRREDCAGFSQRFIRELHASLNAASAPCGVFPVVMEAGCGTLWHEACGHMLEASSIAADTSPFVGRLGQKVASSKVTLVDDGQIPGQYGSTAIDDEGHPTQKNVLIQDGVLVGYLCDRLHGRKIGMESTGSGRRQSYAFAPTARMNNTYLAAGDDDEEEMIRSVPDGLFVKKLGGGNSGREFSIAVSEGYWIKNGQIDRQVKGLTLNGSGAEVIRNVDRVGRVLQYEESGGYCGSDSGLCPVTASQPRVRICEMAIGGEAEA